MMRKKIKNPVGKPNIKIKQTYYFFRFWISQKLKIHDKTSKWRYILDGSKCSSKSNKCNIALQYTLSSVPFGGQLAKLVFEGHRFAHRP